MHRSKRAKNFTKLVDPNKTYSLGEAISILKAAPPTKFDQSVDISVVLGVDPKKPDQQVRGTVALPHGTGKKVTIAVLAEGDKLKEAEEAGADYVGAQDLVDKIKDGWTDFTFLIATPGMMREAAKLGKVLGPRGLMPTPKAGTVTTEVGKAIKELRGGRVEFKVDKSSVVNKAVGKISFGEQEIETNVHAFLTALIQKKPSTSKGEYIKSLVLSTTMGPGVSLKKDFA